MEPVTGKDAVGPREHLACLLGHACAFQFALNAMIHLQTDLLIGALLMAGCAAIAVGRFYPGATWIGLAAAFKATPLLFAPYLLWRRQWRAAGLLVGVAIAVNLLPNLVHPPPGGGLWLSRWCQQYLQPMTASTYRPGDWKNDLNNNQSLAGAVNRWLAGRAGTGTIRASLAGSFILVMAPVLWLLWRRRAWPENVPQTSRPDVRMIECGIVLLLMLLLSPNSSRAHFCILYLPAFCIARLAVDVAGPVLLRTLVIGAAISSTLSIHLRLPGTQVVEQWLLWLGVVTIATLLLLWACIVAGLKKGS
jgi:hypothetical protein